MDVSRSIKKSASLTALYRGYTIEVSGSGNSWTYHASPRLPDHPILARQKCSAMPSREAAVLSAKAEIDRLLRH